MGSERRFALPAQNDLHSVEHFFTLDEETYFLYIYSPRTNEKFATSCSYIYFSHEPQWPRSFPPVVSLAPQCPRMAKRVPLRTRPRVIHVERALLARSETPFPLTNMSLQLCKQHVAGIEVIPNGCDRFENAKTTSWPSPASTQERLLWLPRATLPSLTS